jgi:hypothetical protein
MRLRLLLFASALLLALPSISYAWDYLYDGSVLPNDPSLGANRWTMDGDASMLSTDGNVLHIVDRSTTDGVCFYRSAAPADTPLTVEARVRVTEGDSTILYLGTPSYTPYFELYSDRLVSHLNYGVITYMTNLSLFRTIRVATAAQNGTYTSYVWVDGVLAAQGTATPGGNQYDVIFGAPWSGTGDSYWDYVAYGASFNPVPEPSSLLVLGMGALPIAGLLLRRRRRSE